MNKLLLLGLFSSCVFANEIKPEPTATALDYAQVIQVNAVQSQTGTWCFNTTVKHNDQGWDHYADAWQIIDLKGNVLGERRLAHPHDNEQPFTRSLCNVAIEKPIQQVVVRAKCNHHDWGEKTVTVDLTKESGDSFTVKRAD